MNKALLVFSAAIAALSSAGCDRDVDGNGANRPNAQSPASESSQGAKPADRRAQNPSSQQGVTAQTSFDLVDQNDDEALSRAEASTVAQLDFSAADADKNDSLSRQEYTIAMERARPTG
jgi:hypothetical protein